MRDNQTISINYKLANGTKVEVTVSIEVAQAITVCENKEKALRKQDKRHRVRIFLEDWESTVPSQDEAIPEQVILRENSSKLHKALDTLTEVQRRRVYLHYFANMPYRQIASIEGVNHKSVMRSIEQAVEKLKKQILEQ